MHHFTPESSQIESLTGLIECEAITTASNSDCGVFRMARKGYVRFVKDHRKRILAMELFFHEPVSKGISENKDPLFFKPVHAFEISKSDTIIQAKVNDKLVLRSRKLQGALTIVPKELSKIIFLKERIEAAFVTEANFNSIISAQPSKNDVKKLDPPQESENKPIPQEFKPNPITLPTDASSSGIAEFRRQYQPEKPFDSPIIPKNYFYSNKPLSSISTTTTPATKRRHESIEEGSDKEENASGQGSKDQHTLKQRNVFGLGERKNNFKLQNRNMNIMNNNQPFGHNKSNASSSRFNKEDQENQENLDSISSPVKTWNRTFSSGKSCGKGFANLGNTCYMNAILQCLLNIDTFSIDLMRNYELVKSLTNQHLSSEPSDSQECNLYNCLCELITCQEANDEQVKNECLLGIKNAISKEATRFSGYQQHDAHEFLCQVLDQLKDDVDKINKSGPSATTRTASSSLQLDNPIVDNFQFEVTHAIQCKKCSKVITKNEQYNNLCLEMPANLKPRDDLELSISIQNALDKDFQDEYLNDFKCETCASVQEVVIKRKLTKLPRILILYLKRYQCVEVSAQAQAQPQHQQTPLTPNPESGDQQLIDTIEFFPDDNPQTINESTAKPQQPPPLLPQQPQSSTAQKSYRLVKNDSPIEITRELTLKAHLLDEFNEPKALKKCELDRLRSRSSESRYEGGGGQAISTRSSRKRPQLGAAQERFPPLIDITVSPAKKTPLGKVDENKGRTAFSPLIFNSNAKKNLTVKLDSVATSGDDLIDLDVGLSKSRSVAVESSSDVPTFIDKKMLEEMDEQEQLELAIKMSKKEASNETTTVKLVDAFPKYIDGQLDENGDKEDDDDGENENGGKPVRETVLPPFSSYIKNTLFAATNTLNKYISPRARDISRRSSNIVASRSASATPTVSSDRRLLKTEVDSSSKKQSTVNLDDDDEDMRKALEESLRTHQQETKNRKMLEKLSQEIEEPWPEIEIEKTPEKSYLPPKSSIRIATNKKQPKIDDANSYRIMGIVNHLGMSSNSGHYISDVLDLRSNSWLSYDDREVERLNECDVLSRRVKTGYIFFYIHK